MAAARKLTVTILGNAKGAMQALGMTEKSAKSLTSTIASASKVMAIGLGAVGAAGAYMGKQVFDGAMRAVMGAAEDQKSVALLEKQIRASTFATNEQITANERFIASLQYSAAIADDQLRPALANLVRATGNLTDAQSLLVLSTDIAAATGKDLGDVTLAMGKAATGNVGALTRLGIPLDENAKKAKNFNAIVVDLTKTFGGASDQAVATFDGRMRQLRIGIDEAVESIGYALLPFAERLVTFINTSIVPALQIFADHLTSKGVGGAAQLAVASMGDLGQKGVNGIEAVTMATLVATRKIVDMAEKVLFIATILNMLSGNAGAFAKTWTAGFSADRVKAGIDDAMRTLPGLFDDFRNGVSRASDSLARQAEEAQELERRGIKQKEVTKDNTQLQNQYGGAVGGAAKAIDDAKAKTQQYTAQLKNTQGVQKSAADAAKQLARANDDVVSATAALDQAQKRFNQIVRGYGNDSREAADAQTELSKAQRDAERSGYAVEQAQFAVADAERELAALRRRGGVSPDELREAEIRLAEARLSVADALDTQRESADDVLRAQQALDTVVNGAREGTKEYADALSELKAAQEQYQSAIERQIDARTREAEAIAKVREEEAALAELRRGLPKDTKFDETGAIIEPPKAKRFPSFMAAVRALHPNSPALQSATPVTAARKQFPKLFDEYRQAQVALAAGGIVTRPTTALIGEAGAEAVIPLDRMSQLGAQNITININSTIADDTLPEKIVEALQTYNRRVGPARVQIRA